MTSQRDEIPAELLAFLHTCIDSVEGLQVLLLLLDGGGIPSSIDTLSNELRSSKASVLKRVQDLQSCRVLALDALAANGAVHFHPATPEAKGLVRELALLYRQRPHRVIAQIFARPPSAPLQSFADAFRLKKENP